MTGLAAVDSSLASLAALAGHWANEYERWVTEKPTEAKLVTAMGINLLADLLAQAIMKVRSKSKKGFALYTSWEVLPPLRLVLWGLLCTPLVDSWLLFLDSTFGVETDMVTVDQLLFGPCLLALFLVFVGAFDAVTLGTRFGDTFVDIVGNVFWGTLAGLAYWLPITISMFTVVPLNFRLLVLSLAGMVYNTWLSLWVSGGAGSLVSGEGGDRGTQASSKETDKTEKTKRE